MLESLFNKVADSGVPLYWKETPAQVFSCKFCEIFKNTFVKEHPSGCFLVNLLCTMFPFDLPKNIIKPSIL